ncbi:MAG: TIGR01459 family HAD-type hydrolase [bacterium]|nr:TIGR01459 family HAD-type hydrolase [bacterium]
MSFPQSTPPSFSWEEHFSKASDPYQGFIVDLWGVIHNGVSLFPYVEDSLSQLKKAEKRVVFLSNSPRLKDSVGKQLEGIGLSSDLWDDMVTSGDVTIQQLEEKLNTLGPCGYFLGQPVHRGAFETVKGIVEVHKPDEADFIFNSGPSDLTENLDIYKKNLERSAAKKTPMICANPDVEVIHGGKRILCAGALAQAYEAMGGSVSYSGKSHKQAYDQAFKALGLNLAPNQILALGDSLDNDIQGASNAGIDSILFLSGIHGDTVERLKTLGNLSTEKALEALFQDYGFTPTYVMPSLRW